MVSRQSIKDSIMKLYDKTLNILKERLAKLEGGVCVSIDGWTSECQRRKTIAIFLTFIENWERKRCLLSLTSTEI
jgi:hypothetical protein